MTCAGILGCIDRSRFEHFKATLYSMQPFQGWWRRCTRSQFKPVSTHCWRQRHSITASTTYAMTLVTAWMTWRRNVDLLVPAGTSPHLDWIQCGFKVQKTLQGDNLPFKKNYFGTFSDPQFEKWRIPSFLAGNIKAWPYFCSGATTPGVVVWSRASFTLSNQKSYLWCQPWIFMSVCSFLWYIASGW
jgi:hypothetical protein